MAQMFCTLKQAADKLEMTEAEIEAMLNDGVLREFRDGSNRLLKVADLNAVASVATSTITGRAAQAQRKTRFPRPRRDDDALGLPDLEIRLPAAAVATATRSRVAAPNRPRPTRQSTGRKRPPHAVTPRQAPAQCRQSPPRAVVISPDSTPGQLRPQTYEMSLRQWLWTGLLDDDPIAMLIVFGTALLGMAAVAGAVYLLVRAL